MRSPRPVDVLVSRDASNHRDSPASGLLLRVHGTADTFGCVNGDPIDERDDTLVRRAGTRLVVFADGGAWWLGNLGPAPALDLIITNGAGDDASVVLLADRLDVYAQKTMRPSPRHISVGSEFIDLVVTWTELDRGEQQKVFQVPADGHRSY